MTGELIWPIPEESLKRCTNGIKVTVASKGKGTCFVNRLLGFFFLLVPVATAPTVFLHWVNIALAKAAFELGLDVMCDSGKTIPSISKSVFSY